MKAIYFGDPGGDVEEEGLAIKKFLGKHNINFNIIFTDIPPWEENFDILFFDWGGISIGNSMLEHFCRWIIEHAENHPGNIYVMTSLFTERAMEDAIDRIPEKPNNIYLNIRNEKTINALSVF